MPTTCIQTSSPPCPSKPLIVYVTALLSPSYSVASCRCSAGCSMLEHGYVGISPYLLYLINAPIYLVKGGRLGLSPSVLFHSCRPSFRHIGVMFPDFAFLTRLGDLWDPLDSSPCWNRFIQSELSTGPINPDCVRNAKSGNITLV